MTTWHQYIYNLIVFHLQGDSQRVALGSIKMASPSDSLKGLASASHDHSHCHPLLKSRLLGQYFGNVIWDPMSVNRILSYLASVCYCKALRRERQILTQIACLSCSERTATLSKFAEF